MPRIDSVLSRSAIAYPMAIAVQEWPSGNFMTYKELDSAVTNFASWCQSQQIQNNEVIAIHLPNTKNFLISQFGTFRAGATAARLRWSADAALPCRSSQRSGGAQDLPQARGSTPYRCAQAQQCARPSAARCADGQEKNHR